MDTIIGKLNVFETNCKVMAKSIYNVCINLKEVAVNESQSLLDLHKKLGVLQKYWKREQEQLQDENVNILIRKRHKEIAALEKRLAELEAQETDPCKKCP